MQPELSIKVTRRVFLSDLVEQLQLFENFANVLS